MIAMVHVHQCDCAVDKTKNNRKLVVKGLKERFGEIFSGFQ